MLNAVGAQSLNALTGQIVPKDIQHFLLLRGVRSDMAFNKSAAVFKLA